MTKKNKKLFFSDLLLLIVLAVAIGISMAFSRDIELSLGLCYYVNADGERVEIQSKNASRGVGEELKVHFVDVGQGDCCIIEFPNGEYAVIDGGENYSSVEKQIDAFIEKELPEDFTYFDYCILTHPDSDHCGSLDYILNKYPAKVSYRPNVRATGSGYTDPGAADLSSDARSKDMGGYRNVLNAMYDPTAPHDFTPEVRVTDASDDSQTIIVGEGDDKCTITFYTPMSARYTGDGDWNNYSPIMILDYRGFSFVMSGDAEEKNLREFVLKVEGAPTDGVTDKYDRFDDGFNADVIKAGHHGSENATTPEFLEVMTSPSGVNSTYSVISCGAGNKYGHPHAQAIDRIKAAGIKDENVLRTDLVGDISFCVREDDGVFKLFYGDTATLPVDPTDPEEPSEPIDPPDQTDPDETEIDEQELTLEYKRIGNIKLTWALVAWVCYAVVAVILAVHMAYLYMHGRGKKK